MNTSVLSCLRYVKSNGVICRQSKWNSNNQLMDVFNHKLPRALEKHLDRLSVSDQFRVYARSGSSGLWSDLMYVAFLDKKISRSINGYTPSLGVYPIIMVSPDCQKIYLMYMVAVGSKTKKELEKYVADVRKLLTINGQSTDVNEMDLGRDLKNYKLATICYTELDVDNYTSDTEIMVELQRYIEIHKEFVKTGFKFSYGIR